MDDQQKQLISFVVPVFNEEECVEKLYSRICETAESIGMKFELIYVDDHSIDSTLRIIRGLRERDSRVKIISFSRNFGHQVAVMAGLHHASGDCVITMDADLQDPPELIPEMVAKWQAGADVVHAIRSQREGETAFKRTTAKFFYWFIQLLGAHCVHRDVGDFRLLSRRALAALLQMRETHRFVRGMVGWIGFPSAEVSYQRPERAVGTSKFPFDKMLRLATDAIVSFSRAPLHVAYYLAAILSAVFLTYLAWLLVMHHWFHRPEIGRAHV